MLLEKSCFGTYRYWSSTLPDTARKAIIIIIRTEIIRTGITRTGTTKTRITSGDYRHVMKFTTKASTDASTALSNSSPFQSSRLIASAESSSWSLVSLANPHSPRTAYYGATRPPLPRTTCYSTLGVPGVPAQ